MSDQTNEDLDNESGSALRQQLEQAKKEAKEARERADAAERLNAFASVDGLDLKNKQHTWFKDHYNGKADPEEIRKAAIEAGFLEDTAAQEAEAQTATVIDAEQRLNDASLGAEPADVSTPKSEKLKEALNASSQKEFYDALAAAGMT